MCVCAQVPTYKAGTAAFQEVPTTEIYRPITKGAFAVTSAEQVSNGSNTAAAAAVTREPPENRSVLSRRAGSNCQEYTCFLLCGHQQHLQLWGGGKEQSKLLQVTAAFLTLTASGTTRAPETGASLPSPNPSLYTLLTALPPSPSCLAVCRHTKPSLLPASWLLRA